MAEGAERAPKPYEGDPLKASVFLIRSLNPDKPATKINIFAVTKTLDMIGTPKDVKRLQSGEILVHVGKPAHAKKLLDLSIIIETPVEVRPHPTLNTSKGVIRDRDGLLSECTEKEILEGLAENQVPAIDVRRIMSKRDGQPKPTNTYIITFATPERPKA